MGRSELVEKAKQLYADLLSSFRMTISDSATSNTVEALMTSTLLGIYEVCVTRLTQIFVSRY